MSRPRKPTAVLEASGAFKKNPSRRSARAGEPKPNGRLGNPPATLTHDQRAIWRELVIRARDQHGATWLTKSDFHYVELTSILGDLVRSGTALAADRTQYRACLERLGLSPSTRSHVQVPPDGTGNEFADA